MSGDNSGRVKVRLAEAVALVKRLSAEAPPYVKVIAEQNRVIREANRGVSASPPPEPPKR